jgi:hypothetical protein
MEETEKNKAEVLDELERLLQSLAEPEQTPSQVEVESNMDWDTSFPSPGLSGILMTDVDGKAIGYNRKFLEMWKIPYSVIDSQEGNYILSYILGQLKEPEQFLKKVRECYSRLETKTCARIELKNGKAIELYSQPQRTDGISVGRIWTFHEITEAREVVRPPWMEARRWLDRPELTHP